MQLSEDKVDFALLKLEASGEINQQADLQLEWDGLSAGNESHQLIYLAPVRANLQLQNVDGAWLSPVIGSTWRAFVTFHRSRA